MSYGRVITLKANGYWNDNIPEDFIKRELAHEFVDCLLRDGYLDFEISQCDENRTLRRVTASMKVVDERG